TNGSVISEKPLIEASAPRTLNAATDGRGRFAITWARLDPTATFEVYTLSVHYAIVDRDGTVLKAPTLLERSPVTFAPGAIRGGNMSVAERPAIVWDGNQFVVAWRWFDGAGNNGTRVARIAADGATAEIEPTPTSPYTSHYYTLGWSAPVMVKTDTSLLLQWPRLEPRGTSRVARLVQHVAPLGTRMHNTAPVPLSVPPLAQLGVALAGGDGGMLAVWQEDRTPAPVLKARLFPHHGTRTAEMVVSTGRYAYSPAILWGGGVYLVVWREDEFKANRDPRIGHILARRYDGSGTPIDAAPITLASEHYTNRYLPYQTIGLAFDGQQFLAVWGAVNDRGVHGSRIPPAGPPRDHPPLVIAVSASPAPRAGAPQAIWNGRQFLVIWYEDPIPDSNGSAGLPRLPHYARTTLVGTDGKVVDRSFPAIVTTPQGFEFVRSGFEAASNGREVMVTWAYVYNNFAPFRGCAYAQRFTLEGKPLDSAPAEVLCQPAAAFFSRAGAPRVIWHQEQWWLVYSVILPEGGVFAAPLSDRRVLGPPVRLSAQPGLDGIASTALGLAAGFVQLDPAYGNVYGVFFSRMGSGRARSVRH
ncbi:MAG TPA: hypothetical protein VE010_02825, partial [Thermoanaerobaculia bacterium]|nr:hypothetical protein [Thermoanaerobaculia bacterium]